jgi:hypothetical protein
LIQQLAHEVETHAADAAAVERRQILLVEAVVDECDAAPLVGRVGDGVERGAIIFAVATRLHDHRALDTEQRMQRCQRLFGRVLRRVAALRRVGKFRRRPEHVVMRVGRAGGQFEARLAAVGKIVRHLTLCAS